MDPNTMLAQFIPEGKNDLCVNFQLRTKHNAMEAKAFAEVVKYYNAPTLTVNMNVSFLLI